MSDQTAADLRAAAEVLRREGWTQAEYHRPCGHCAQGAIAVVTGFHAALRPYSDEALDFDLVWDQEVEERSKAAREALGRHLGRASWTVPVWNDAPGRTADEVIAALLAAADAQAAEQQAQPQSGDRP